MGLETVAKRPCQRAFRRFRGVSAAASYAHAVSTRPPTRALLRQRATELRRAALPIAQSALAAGAAWLIATEIWQHQRPFFAPIAAIICLGATHLQRMRRTVELTIGVALGIAVGDALVAGIGVGTWQLMLVVALAMAAAVFVGGGPLLITQAAVSAVLVVTLQPPGEGIYLSRFVDALTGGLVGILVAIAIPVDPLALARRAVRPLLGELAGTLEDIAAALEAGDPDAAEKALRRARAADAPAASFHDAVVAGSETARLAPPRWAMRDALAHYAEADPQLDLAVRNVRVLARGALRALQLNDHVPPDLAVALRELAEAVRGLQKALADDAGDRPGTEAARAAALRAAGRATLVLERTGNLSVSVLVGQVRSTAVDLLRALGVADDEARTAVRAAAQELYAQELATGSGTAEPPSGEQPASHRRHPNA